MKYIKLFFLFILLVSLFTLPVNAANTDNTLEDIYELLPEDAKEIMGQEGLLKGDFAEQLDAAGLFSLIFRFFKEGLDSPLSSLVKGVSVLILSALMTGYAQSNKIGAAVDSVCMLSTSLIMALPVYEIIAASRQALKGVCTFMTGSVPVFAAVKAASGKPVSITGGAGVLLFACQALSYLCAFLVVPFMNSYLALSICSSFGGKNTAAGIMNGIKKVSMWVLSLCASIFVFVLGAKGTLGKGADTVAMKTAKFVLGTTVPVVGTALSESASNVAASLSALSGTAGIYIILGVVIIILPLLLELVCWRLLLMVFKYLSVLFSVPNISSLAESLESVMSLLLGFCLLCVFLLIISLGVLISL